MFRKSVKLRGMNRRMIAVDATNVLFLEEHELDGNLCTNVHFTNGKWVTSALSLNEVDALLMAKEDDRTAEQMTRWEEMAKEKAKTQAEIDAYVRGLNFKKPDGWSKETMPDGTFKVTLNFDTDPSTP